MYFTHISMYIIIHDTYMYIYVHQSIACTYILYTAQYAVLMGIYTYMYVYIIYMYNKDEYYRKLNFDIMYMYIQTGLFKSSKYPAN